MVTEFYNSRILLYDSISDMELNCVLSRIRKYMCEREEKSNGKRCYETHSRRRR